MNEASQIVARKIRATSVVQDAEDLCEFTTQNAFVVRAVKEDGRYGVRLGTRLVWHGRQYGLVLGVNDNGKKLLFTDNDSAIEGAQIIANLLWTAENEDFWTLIFEEEEL